MKNSFLILSKPSCFFIRKLHDSFLTVGRKLINLDASFRQDLILLVYICYAIRKRTHFICTSVYTEQLSFEVYCSARMVFSLSFTNLFTEQTRPHLRPSYCLCAEWPRNYHIYSCNVYKGTKCLNKLCTIQYGIMFTRWFGIHWMIVTRGMDVATVQPPSVPLGCWWVYP